MKKILLMALMSLYSFGASYQLDNSHSEVGFSVKHMMITNTKGKFKDFETDITVSKKGLEKVSATIYVSSIDTNNMKRDNHLKSDDFFDLNKYKTIEFKSTKIIEDKVYGLLTMKNISKEIILEIDEFNRIKDFAGNNRVGFTLLGKINRKDFGLTWNKVIETGGVAVGEKVKLIIEIEAVEK